MKWGYFDIILLDNNEKGRAYTVKFMSLGGHTLTQCIYYLFLVHSSIQGDHYNRGCNRIFC